MLAAAAGPGHLGVRAAGAAFLATSLRFSACSWDTNLPQTTDKITEDQPEPEYFTLLATGLAALNKPDVPVELIKVWFAVVCCGLLA